MFRIHYYHKVDIEVNYVALGNKIREVRNVRGYTQEDLGNIIDMTPNYLSRLECARTKISLPTLLKITRALNTSVDYLLSEDLHIEPAQGEVLNLLSGCSEKDIDFILKVLKTTVTALKEYENR